MAKFYSLILFFVVFSFYGQENEVKSSQTLDTLKTIVDKVKTSKSRVNTKLCFQFDSIIDKNKTILKPYEIKGLYMELAENLQLNSTEPDLLVLVYFKKAILSGYTFATVLNLETGLYIKKHFPEKYIELEHLSDSMYVISCNKFVNVDINLQLGFLLRYMIRKDQDVRTRELIYSKSINNLGTVADSFSKEMNKTDSLNEILLTEIFEEYGFPGWNLIGSEGGVAFVIFNHISTDFQVKYIHLLEQAMQNKQLAIDENNFKFLIDKVLYKKYKLTLYGTHYTKAPPEKDKAVINKYRALLKLSLEE